MFLAPWTTIKTEPSSKYVFSSLVKRQSKLKTSCKHVFSSPVKLLSKLKTSSKYILVVWRRYAAVLADCQACYFAQRQELTAPTIYAKMTELNKNHQNDLPTWVCMPAVWKKKACGRGPCDISVCIWVPSTLYFPIQIVYSCFLMNHILIFDQTVVFSKISYTVSTREYKSSCAITFK